MRRDLPDEAATEALGRALAKTLPRPVAGVIALEGSLGAGKSTLARALLRELRVTGTIRSPTYTLVEPYESPAGRVLHMDCYRLGDAEELDMLGLRDSPPESTLWLVEWPERAAGALPAIDLAIRLTLQGKGRSAEIDARQNGRLEQTLHSLHE
ncbi:tRNA (adenosine(37)-N6)-threonylcarbamoyltransferase complex ATPase subunit type 1 TsaE [Algiphilus aromaticivorans]|uniref:tRNA (adenosine(37)-N6)-threonylcarbamoyltransferase complex ATPase subunit type 1 TsaE n=1 Tax=Algiphilus aromaticivorans TaxID=382454 RepID=UPI0005C2257B|nr:tRNA (adenosine(37)-N6)-threonylcarbamoyltransferase complex ATPase subunit type 1 TsaE [Algiphilus aromaticivorans]